MSLKCPFCNGKIVLVNNYITKYYGNKAFNYYMCECYNVWNSWKFNKIENTWYYWENHEWLLKSVKPTIRGFVFR